MDNNSPTELLPAREAGKGALRLMWRGFWLAFLVVSLAYAWYCFYTPSNSVSWAPDYAAARELSVQTEKPVVLFFTATWCVPCRIMKRTVWADGQVAAEVNARFIPLMVYADDPAMAEVFSHYQVGATPTTIITDPQGNVLQRAQGNMGKADFLNLLEKL